MGRMTPDERRAAFEAQEARLRTIEIRIPKDWDRDRASKALSEALQGRVYGDAAELVSAVGRGLDLALVKRCTRCGGELSWHAGMGVWLTRQPMGGFSDQCPAGTINRYHWAPEGTAEI